MKKIALFVTIVVMLVACQKDVQVNPKQPKPEGDDFLNGQYNLVLRQTSHDLLNAASAFRIRERLRPKPVHIPQDASCIYLNFDGDTVKANDGVWNYSSSPLFMKYSGLTIDQISNIVAAFERYEAYGQFNAVVTTDPDIFHLFDPKKRQKIVFTESYSWYGSNSGGVSFPNSRSWGDDTPCFVFTSLLHYNENTIGQAGIHESGHQLGLVHQSDWVGGVMKNLYSAGITKDHAPFMGVSYGDPNGGEWVKDSMVSGNWSILNEWGGFQNDWKRIVDQIGLK